MNPVIVVAAIEAVSKLLADIIEIMRKPEPTQADFDTVFNRARKSFDDICPKKP